MLFDVLRIGPYLGVCLRSHDKAQSGTAPPVQWHSRSMAAVLDSGQQQDNGAAIAGKEIDRINIIVLGSEKQQLKSQFLFI